MRDKASGRKRALVDYTEQLAPSPGLSAKRKQHGKKSGARGKENSDTILDIPRIPAEFPTLNSSPRSVAVAPSTGIREATTRRQVVIDYWLRDGVDTSSWQASRGRCFLVRNLQLRPRRDTRRVARKSTLRVTKGPDQAVGAPIHEIADKLLQKCLVQRGYSQALHFAIHHVKKDLVEVNDFPAKAHFVFICGEDELHTEVADFYSRGSQLGMLLLLQHGIIAPPQGTRDIFVVVKAEVERKDGYGRELIVNTSSSKHISAKSVIYGVRHIAWTDHKGELTLKGCYSNHTIRLSDFLGHLYPRLENLVKGKFEKKNPKETPSSFLRYVYTKIEKIPDVECMRVEMEFQLPDMDREEEEEEEAREEKKDAERKKAVPPCMVVAEGFAKELHRSWLNLSSPKERNEALAKALQTYMLGAQNRKYRSVREDIPRMSSSSRLLAYLQLTTNRLLFTEVDILKDRGCTVFEAAPLPRAGIKRLKKQLRRRRKADDWLMHYRTFQDFCDSTMSPMIAQEQRPTTEDDRDAPDPEKLLEDVDDNEPINPDAQPAWVRRMLFSDEWATMSSSKLCLVEKMDKYGYAPKSFMNKESRALAMEKFIRDHANELPKDERSELLAMLLYSDGEEFDSAILTRLLDELRRIELSKA